MPQPRITNFPRHKKKRWGTNNGKTNVPYETDEARIKQKCKRGTALERSTWSTIKLLGVGGGWGNVSFNYLLAWMGLEWACISIHDALPGEGGTCSLVPLKKKSAFSLVPQNQNLDFYVPCSLQFQTFVPLFSWNKWPYSLFPKPPGRSSFITRILEPPTPPPPPPQNGYIKC